MQIKNMYCYKSIASFPSPFPVYIKPENELGGGGADIILYMYTSMISHMQSSVSTPIYIADISTTRKECQYRVLLIAEHGLVERGVAIKVTHVWLASFRYKLNKIIWVILMFNSHDAVMAKL